MSKVVALVLDEQTDRKLDSDAAALGERLGKQPSRSWIVREAIRAFSVSGWLLKLSTDTAEVEPTEEVAA